MVILYGLIKLRERKNGMNHKLTKKKIAEEDILANFNKNFYLMTFYINKKIKDPSLP